MDLTAPRAVLLALLLAAPAGAQSLRQQIRELPQKYQDWIQEVRFLISDEELEAFLELEKDYQREAFIRTFWRVRDPFPDTVRNEFRERWYERLDMAVELFGGLEDERARMLLMNGAPDSRVEVNCTMVLWPLEIWYYDGSERVKDEFFLVFYREMGLGDFRIWRPREGFARLADGPSNMSLAELAPRIVGCSEGQYVLRVLRFLLSRGPMDFDFLLSRIERPTETPSEEWLATFATYSTDLPEEATPLRASLDVGFPGRHQSRTLVEAVLRVPTGEATESRMGEGSSYNFLVTGEVLREETLFESFRYRFAFPATQIDGDELHMVFQRRLRPGRYRLIVKLEDANGSGVFREERDLDVPRVEAAPAPVPDDPETARLLEEATTAMTAEEPTLRIVPPRGEMHTGMVRFETLTTGTGIDEVRFVLDGRTVLRKARPPYSVELDLGSIPEDHTLRAVALDEAGRELARDEITVNAGAHRFVVRFVEPEPGKSYEGRVEARVRVEAPEDSAVERVELFLDETRVATLYQPPWSQPIDLSGTDEEMRYLRAVAYLTDGNSTEDLVFINAPDLFLEQIDVEFVELYATVLDRDGHPIQNLTREDFVVLEDGVEQRIARFEQVRNLPIHAQIMIDVSASMEEDLPEAQRAALRFFEEALTPKDRAAIVTFNDRPNLAVKLTNDVATLAAGLGGLRAERGTALYDSLIFGLYYMNGIKGQRTILLLSDGKDESSRFGFDEVLDYARRSGTAIYPIGLNLSGGKSAIARKNLSQLADETGGRSFFIKDVGELGDIYRQIQEELRSRYLIAYQSTNTDRDGGFRFVDLRVDQQGAQAKTIRGYYP